MNKVIISVHSFFTKEGKDIYGTGYAIADFLKERKIPYIFIKHPIYGGFPTKIENSSIVRKKVNNLPLPFRVFQEFKITDNVICHEQPIDLFIGIDPVNALYGIIAKKRGKVKRVIFYTADYAIKRFNNPLMNVFYHFVDNLAIKYADEVWNVSTRITELRKKQGTADSRNFFVPNSASFQKIKRLDYRQINKHELVLVSTISKSIDFYLIFNVIRNLEKKYKDINIKIIGPGEWKKEFGEYVEKLGINKHVKFFGSIERSNLLTIIKKSAIGLAIYNNKNSWTYFADSMKARDYLACGLPVIITNVLSTADDIKKGKAGFVVGYEEKELTRVLDNIFQNEKKYKTLRENAIKLAKKFDIDSLLSERIFGLFSNDISSSSGFTS